MLYLMNYTKHTYEKGRHAHKIGKNKQKRNFVLYMPFKELELDYLYFTMKLHIEPLSLLAAGTEQVQNETVRELVKAASAQWNSTHRFSARGPATETH